MKSMLYSLIRLKLLAVNIPGKAYDKGGLCSLVASPEDCMASSLLRYSAKAGVIHAPLLFCIPAQLKEPSLA